MQTIPAVRNDWSGKRQASRERSHGDLEAWERAYQIVPVPGAVNAATDAQRADAYRAAGRACLRLMFGGSRLGEPAAKEWGERVWAIVQQYGVGRGRDVDGAYVEATGYETALYDILDWYRDVANDVPRAAEAAG
jgi:hypothetical protein